MDWDGVGTFALFLSSGAIGLGLICLAGFRAKLKNKLEHEKLRQASGGSVDDLREEMHQLFERQGAELADLNERIDFTERLLTQGRESDAAEEE